MTLRSALENSRNLVTARLLKGGIDENPRESLFKVCDLAEEANLYPECMRLYPFILGAQAIRMIDLAGFYAAIASEGAYRTPYAIEAIDQKDREIYRHPDTPPTWLAGGDRVAFYQLRTILEGVVARGTATSAMGHLAQYVGGKTGTTDNENDTWFASFTSDVTVVVWVGYDNLSGRRTLGQGATGGHLAAPIAEPIIQASWLYHAPKTLLPPPSPEAQRHLRAVQVGGRGEGYTDYLRTNDAGRVVETKYAIVGKYAASDEGRDYDARPASQGPSETGWGRAPRISPSTSTLTRQEDR